MKGMNISRNAFIGEINIQDIAAEREQPHNWAKNFMNLTKNYSFLTTVWPEPILINFVENTTYCITKVVYIHYDPLMMQQKEARRKHPCVLPKKVAFLV